MPDEVGWRARRSTAREVGGARADDAPDGAEAQRDQPAVGQDADPQGRVDMAFGEVDDPVLEDEANVDIGISRQELSDDREEMQPPEADRCRQDQFAGRRRIFT